jgi:hypothetical protein
MSTIIETIKKEILSWPYVTAKAHRFGGIEFRLSKRELGHIHGDRLADLPFPMSMRNELVNSGRVTTHHVLPQSGWVSYWIRDEEDIPAVIEYSNCNTNASNPNLLKKKKVSQKFESNLN